MKRTSAAGSVDNRYVDEDLENEIQGTSLVAADRNAIQEELMAVIEGAGLTPSESNLTQVWAALTKGSGSNINSDKLDGQEGSYYRNAGNLNAGTIPSARISASAILTLLLGVDGSGSGLDADKLDGAHKDTDSTLGGNSDSSIPTEKAVKAYVDAHKNNESNPHSVTRTQLGLAAASLAAEINNSLKGGSICPFAVGAFKIQFPGESAPGTLWSGTTWSAQFESEGIFFRTPGGYASSFNGGIQSDAFQGHIHYPGAGVASTSSSLAIYGTTTEVGSAARRLQTDVNAPGIQPKTSVPKTDDSHGTPRTASETRPNNRTIRVWKRTA